MSRFHLARDSAGRRRARQKVSGLAVAAALGGSQSVVVSGAGAQQANPNRPTPVPALASTPTPEAPVPAAAGDFRGAPPHPDQRSADPPTPRESFDPARSRVVDPETTPTRLVHRNDDGTRTAELSPVPVRVKDQSGAWRDIDRSVWPPPAGDWSPGRRPSP